MIPIWIALVAAALGGRHAFAPDHLAAVGTYVEKTGATRRQGLLCALRIAGGHSIGMLAIAGLVEGLLLTLSPAWMTATTWASSVWLMLMAVLVLWDLTRDLWGGRRHHASTHTHDHGLDEGAGGVGEGRAPSRFRRLQGKWIQKPATAWLVGLLFGLAVAPGDLAIFTMMIRYHAQPVLSFGLLLIFLAAMFAGLAIVGSGLGWANGRVLLRRGFQALSGVAGMAVSLALVTGLLH